MNSGVLFALLLCLSCGLWIRAEEPENKGLLYERHHGHHRGFHHHHHHHGKHHHHHHRHRVHLPHIWKLGHHRCPAGFTLYGNRCLRNYYQPPFWQPPVWRPPYWQPQFWPQPVWRPPYWQTPYWQLPVRRPPVRRPPYWRPPYWQTPYWQLPVRRPPYFQPPVRRSCPNGWTQHGRRCFLFINSENNWDSAEQHCRILGAHLASFHSYSELNFLRHLVYRGAGSFRNTWVGGTDRGHNRIWTWTDGSRYNYNHWYPGEPNNSGGREECMEINFNGSDGNNDSLCFGGRPFICARRL